MKKSWRALFTLFADIVLLCSPAWATTYNAATCSQTDVQTAINSTSNGDTVIIPACSSANWSSGITISGKGIDITGSGTPNTGSGTVGAGTSTTTLIETGTSPFFSFTGLAYGQTAKVELLNLGTTQTSPVITGAVTFAGTCTSSGCAQVRVDNILFATNEWGAALDGAPIVVDNIFGVADHNSESDNTSSPFLTDISFDAWQGVGAYGDNSFANSSSFGTAQSFYIENNSVSGVRLTENDVAPPGGAVGGARWVCRFNTVTNMSGNGICGGHGTAWGGRFRGERQQEVYYNTISASVCDGINSVLSGTGYFLSNSITGTGCNKMVGLDIARFIQSGTPWNACDGTQPWDYAPWSSTTACLDQPGSGIGAALENSTPVLVSAPSTPCTTAGQCWPNPTLDPIYEAGEVSPNNAPGVSVASDGSSTRVLANRDYYAQVSDVAQTSATSPFNGSSGTGYGTLARRPTSCTPYVGYWATDQGTWNNGGAGGILYICTSTNTWTSSYTPYTYPHPLAGGSSAAGQPSSPTIQSASPIVIE